MSIGLGARAPSPIACPFGKLRARGSVARQNGLGRAGIFWLLSRHWGGGAISNRPFGAKRPTSAKGGRCGAPDFVLFWKIKTKIPRLRAPLPARVARGWSRYARDDNAFAARLKPCPDEKRRNRRKDPHLPKAGRCGAPRAPLRRTSTEKRRMQFPTLRQRRAKGWATPVFASSRRC